MPSVPADRGSFGAEGKLGSCLPQDIPNVNHDDVEYQYCSWEACFNSDDASSRKRHPRQGSTVAHHAQTARTAFCQQTVKIENFALKSVGGIATGASTMPTEAELSRRKGGRIIHTVRALGAKVSPRRWSLAGSMEEAGRTGNVTKQQEAEPDLGDAMHRAVRDGRTQRVTDLIKRGASASARCGNGDALIHLAAKLDHKQIVTVLLQNGADSNSVDSRGRTPLHLAAIHGHLSVAIALLEAGADIGIIFRDASRYEHLALSFAARMGHVHVLRALLRYGANVNAASSTGLTALHYAAVRNQRDAIDVLAKADGVDLEARVADNGGGGTPLHASSVMCCFEASLSLLQHGATVDAKNVFGYSPLHGVARQAGKRGAARVADLLLRWGADETAVDYDGNTPADLIGSSRMEGEHRDEEDIKSLRDLLRSAPADRAWRRRGFLVLCRAFPKKLYPGHQSRGSNAAGAAEGDPVSSRLDAGSAEKVDVTLHRSTRLRCNGYTGLEMVADAHGSSGVVGEVLGFAEEGLFRNVVGFL